MLYKCSHIVDYKILRLSFEGNKEYYDIVQILVYHPISSHYIKNLHSNTAHKMMIFVMFNFDDLPFHEQTRVMIIIMDLSEKL